MTRIAILVSGGGTNLQALLDAQARGELGSGRIVRVIASTPGAYALERARLAGVATAVIQKKAYASFEAFDAALEADLVQSGIELVVLAGYLAIVGPRVLGRYGGRVLNVHPSLLPAFGGKGFYGLKVHEAALEYGVKVTGATVHFVSEVVDGGRILLQRAVPVLEGDTPEKLQRRVMEQAEWVILPQAVAILSDEIESERGSENGEETGAHQRIR